MFRIISFIARLTKTMVQSWTGGAALYLNLTGRRPLVISSATQKVRKGELMVGGTTVSPSVVMAMHPWGYSSNRIRAFEYLSPGSCPDDPASLHTSNEHGCLGYLSTSIVSVPLFKLSLTSPLYYGVSFLGINMKG